MLQNFAKAFFSCTWLLKKFYQKQWLFYFWFILALKKPWSVVLVSNNVIYFIKKALLLQTKDDETALHCAAQYGHTAVVNLLLEHRCDPSIKNSRGETALDLAAQYGR